MADDASPESARPVVTISRPPERAPLKRTWPQRLTIGAVFLAGLGCFVAGGGLYAAQRIVEDRNVVAIESPSDAGADTEDSTFDATAAGDGAPDDGPTVTADIERPVETFPQAEPEARNFLITGADNNACIDPDSPYAGAFGDRSGFGERSDTIMLWRVNPATSQVAVLSFPRDLWVNIAGRSGQQRINTAYERDQPQRLIDTIYQNFLVPVDHFIQVDFCAFKLLVDAVDGVSVPFEFPVRDAKTGLNVPTAGCYRFDGDHALAYVRSRYLEYLDEDGEWQTDGTSDFGRISRQQDFIRRTVDSLLAAGAFDPSVIRALIETSDDYVVYDTELTTRKILEFAGVLRAIDPAQITTYQIEVKGTTISGNQVLLPQLGGSNMQSVLRVFRGEATLADAPEQELDDTSGDAPADSTPATGSAPADDADAPDGTVDPGEVVDEPAETLPVVEAEANSKGIYPDPDVACG